MELENLMLTLICLLAFGVCLFVAKYAERMISTRWKLLYVLPAALCMVGVGMAGFYATMLPLYLGCAVALAGFFDEKKKTRQIVSILAMFLSVAAIVLTALSD